MPVSKSSVWQRFGRNDLAVRRGFGSSSDGRLRLSLGRSSVLPEFASFGRSQAESLAPEAITLPVPFTFITATSWYSRCGKLAKIMVIFDSMPVPAWPRSLPLPSAASRFRLLFESVLAQFLPGGQPYQLQHPRARKNIR